MTTTPPAGEVPEPAERLWVEFIDPAEPAQRFRCDLTWLTSSYRCVFGAGCRGIDAERPDDGCCGLGAHFTDEEDLERVRAVVDRLDEQDWQYAHVAAEIGWDDTEEGEATTRVVDGACILLNRAGFPGGAGCALHRRALDDEVSPHAYKPDVCWQLPLRRTYREVEEPDGTSYLEASIGEYTRSAWGPGGHDFDWFCTSSPLAHASARPLFRGSEPELRELMGDAAYEELAVRCEAHLAAVAAVAARPAGRSLLPLWVHPATLAAS